MKKNKPMKATSVRLSADQRKQLDKLGGGSVTAGIRRAAQIISGLEAFIADPATASLPISKAMDIAKDLADGR